jgi:hypothetical protein
MGQFSGLSMESADSIWPFALTAGASEHPKDGACLTSAISWLVYGDLSDQPACVSEVVGEVARHVNDLLPDYRRQALKSYIPRLIDTNDGDSTERARLRFVHQYIIEELFPLGLAAAGLDFLIPVLRRVAPNHVVRLKPFVDEIVGQALCDPSWPEEAMTVLQSRIERGLWVQGGTAAPETIGSVLEGIALAMELKPPMVSQFYDGLVGMLDGVLLIGRCGLSQFDHAVAEERIQAFAEAA